MPDGFGPGFAFALHGAETLAGRHAGTVRLAVIGDPRGQVLAEPMMVILKD